MPNLTKSPTATRRTAPGVKRRLRQLLGQATPGVCAKGRSANSHHGTLATSSTHKAIRSTAWAPLHWAPSG